MLVTAAAVAAVITGIAVAANAVQGKQPNDPNPISAIDASPTTTTEEPPTRSRPSTSPLTTTPAGKSTSSSASPTQSPAAPPAAEAGAVPAGEAGAVTTATEFMTRWVRPPEGTTTQEWMKPLVPLVMPEMVTNLESVAPANIPATAVTGSATVVRNEGGVAEVDVPTDAGVIRVRVVAYPDGRWLVREWAPVTT